MSSVVVGAGAVSIEDVVAVGVSAAELEDNGTHDTVAVEVLIGLVIGLGLGRGRRQQQPHLFEAGREEEDQQDRQAHEQAQPPMRRGFTVARDVEYRVHAPWFTPQAPPNCGESPVNAGTARFANGNRHLPPFPSRPLALIPEATLFKGPHHEVHPVLAEGSP